MQHIFHLQQTLAFFLGQLYHRHTRPAGNNLSNFLLGHFTADTGVLALPFRFLLFQFLLLFFFLVTQTGGAFKILLVDSGFFFLRQPFDFVLQLFQICRRRVRFQAHLRRRFIHQVDGFIRQIPVGNIARRHGYRGFQCFIGDFHIVVRCIFRTQSAQNLQCLFRSRLPYRYRMEPTLQRCILFNVFAVFFQRCGTNDL